MFARLATAIDRRWRRFTHGWHRTNCLFFAVALYFRRHARIRQASNGPLYRRRHYFTLRQSDSGAFPHFLYVEHGRRVHFISYKPPHPIDRKCPPLMFEGVVRWGDAPNLKH